MGYSVDWDTRIITIPKSDLIDVGGNIYELNLQDFHKKIRELEWQFNEGLSRDQVLEYIRPITAGGTTYARFVLLINNYKIEFENGQYAVNLIGANTNLQDNVVVNSVSVRSNNSAGLTEQLNVDEIVKAIFDYNVSCNS